MDNISKNVLEQIKQEHITPRPRWEFALKNSFFWLIFAFLVVLGGLAVSVIIFMLTDQDWAIYRHLNKSFVEYLLLSIPYFWFLLVSLFVAVAWFEFKNTKTGYKHSFIKIGFINILASVVLGLLFFYSGLGLKTDRIFADHIPLYQSMHPYRTENIWANPGDGFLVGEITSISGENTFFVLDPLQKEWLVDCSDCDLEEDRGVSVGMIVRTLGEKIDEANFKAFEVRIGRPELGPKLMLRANQKNGPGSQGQMQKRMR